MHRVGGAFVRSARVAAAFPVLSSPAAASSKFLVTLTRAAAAATTSSLPVSRVMVSTSDYLPIHLSTSFNFFQLLLSFFLSIHGTFHDLPLMMLF